MELESECIRNEQLNAELREAMMKTSRQLRDAEERELYASASRSPDTALT